MLEKWTNTSSPPSREMKPKPFSALKNFTVPVVMLVFSVVTDPIDRHRDRIGYGSGTPQSRPRP
jgi:hypothetical protein